MSLIGKFEEIYGLYRKHGWRLARVLARPETIAALRKASAGGEAAFEGVAASEAEVDAMWFTRAAAGGREAWELRLVADTPYALFEMFEPDEEEEDREDVRREMQARLVEYAGGGQS